MVRGKHAIAALREWWDLMLAGNCDPIKLSKSFQEVF